MENNREINRRSVLLSQMAYLAYGLDPKQFLPPLPANQIPPPVSIGVLERKVSEQRTAITPPSEAIGR